MNARIDAIAKTLIRERWTFLSVFTAVVVVYGSALFFFSLSIDEEMALMHGSDQTFVSQGRWGIVALRRTLFPVQLSPFFSPLLTLSLLCVAACAIAAELNLRGMEKTAFCILYASFPQFAYQLYFSIQSDCVAFGLIGAAVVFYAFKRFMDDGKTGFLLLSIGLYTFIIGIYQALFIIPPILCLLNAVGNMSPAEDERAEAEFSFSVNYEFAFCALFACASLASLAAYVGVSRLVSVASEIPISDYLASRAAWLAQPFESALAETKSALLLHLTGKAYYGEILQLGLYPALFIVGRSLLRQKTAAAKLWTAATLTALFLLPFAQLLFLGGDQAPRTLLGQGLVFAGLWAFALRRASWNGAVVFAGVTLSVFAASAHANKLFFEKHMTWEADKLFANRVISRIYAAHPDFSADAVKVYIRGAPKTILPKIPAADVFGSSLFTHDGGNIYRTQAFFKTHGIASLIRPTQAEIEELLPIAATMPTWPHARSVGMVNGVMVVNLGPRQGYFADMAIYKNNP